MGWGMAVLLSATRPPPPPRRVGWLPALGATLDLVITDTFVGRRDEQERFSALLKALAPTRRIARPRAPRRISRSADDARSRVVLICGLGGSGKSSLLRRFRDMADGSLPGAPIRPGRIRPVWLDWEDERQQQQGSYAGVAGPSVVTVLDAIQRAVLDAFNHKAKAARHAREAFNSYRQGAARMPQYAARFADVIAQARKGSSPFTSQDAGALLKALSSAGLTAAGHPAGILALTPAAISDSAEAVGHLSETVVRAVTGKDRGAIPADEYDLVTDPARELSRRIAVALQTIATRDPLVIELDTGEIVGPDAWTWLRQIMVHTGQRVIWVVGARFATESEAGPDSPVAGFIRDIGNEHLVLMSPTRFDDAMIGEYLRNRTGGSSYSDSEIDMIAGFTRGLPLAVSFVAELLDSGQSVIEICGSGDTAGQGNVVSRLARRYLVHAEQQTYAPGDPRRDDVAKIVGLALAYGDLRSDPDLLAALWDVTNPFEAFQDLARRHDFVLPVSLRLHDEVKDVLRVDLLNPYRRGAATGINRRALNLFMDRLKEMRRRWASLDEQLSRPGFKTTLMSALWHALWLDNQAGLDALIEVLPVLAVADPVSANSAAAMSDRFAAAFTADQLNDLNLMTHKPSEHANDALMSTWSPRITKRLSTALIGWLDQDASDDSVGRSWLATMPSGKGNLFRSWLTDDSVIRLLIDDLGTEPIVSSSRQWLRSQRLSSPSPLSWLLPSTSLLATFLSLFPAERRVRLTIDGLMLPSPGIAGGTVLLGETGDRQSAVHIVLAREYAQQEDYVTALASLREAVRGTASQRLRQAIKSQAGIIARLTGHADSDQAPHELEVARSAAELADEIDAD